MMFLLAIPFSVVLCIVTFVQLLYLESLRLRTREYPALAYFKSTLEEKFGMDTEQGMLAYSMLKHMLLVITGSVFVIAAYEPGIPRWLFGLEGLITGVIIMILATYALPQILYRRSTGKWLLAVVPLLRALTLLMWPITTLLRFLQGLFELGNGGGEEEKPADPNEQIEALITAGEEEGLIEKEDRRLIQSAVAFGDKRVREVMTPRRNIVGIDVNSSLDELRRLVIHEQFSRIPVFQETVDRMLGFVHVRDILELDSNPAGGNVGLGGIVRPIETVPETKLASELLRDMQSKASHMACVVDEYGNTAGLVTLEDLVEELVGEIRDEHEPAHDVETCADGSIIVAGSFDVDHLSERFDFRPSEPHESTTVGGLVSEWLGAVPKAGEVVIRDGLRIEVLAASDRMVEQVRISLAPPAGETAIETVS